MLLAHYVIPRFTESLDHDLRTPNFIYLTPRFYRLSESVNESMKLRRSALSIKTIDRICARASKHSLKILIFIA